MIQFTLYTSKYKANLSNCLYQEKRLIKTEKYLEEAIKFDHVTAEYKNNYKSNKNFIRTGNIPLDCDNNHSDDPKDWVSLLDVTLEFEGVSFAVAYSRNHMKEKDSQQTKISCLFSSP